MNVSLTIRTLFISLLALTTSAFYAGAQVLTFDQAKQRADQGDAFAQAVVALHCQLGWQTEKDVAAAARYALNSANAGHPYGLFRLGSLYVSGDGVEKNPDLGYRLQAQSSQGLMQLAQDRAKPDPYAMTAVGIANFQGKVTPQNRELAAEWYKEAAKYGFAPAIFNYIMCEIEGHGLPKHTATHPHFVRQVQDMGAGCVCASCSLGGSNISDYPPAKHYIAENVGKVEEEGRAALAQHGAPALEEEYWKGEQHPETLIYEPTRLLGSSSLWYKLLAVEGVVDVYVRANYTGITKISEAFANAMSAYSFESYMGSDGGIFTNLQFLVTETPEGLHIKPNSPLAKKNRMGLHEYPIALEFKVTNRGQSNVHLESLGFDVARSVIREESLPGLIFEGDYDDGNCTIAVHNFGWSSWEQGAHAKLGLWDPSQNLAEYKSIELFPNKPTQVPLKDLKYSPFLEATLGAHPDYSNGRIMILETAETRSWFEPNFSRNARDFYTRIDGDVRLPAGREAYRVLFDVKRNLAAGETLLLNATFDFDKSVNAALIPLLVADGGAHTGPEIACEYECFNHYYDPPNSTFAIDGNGDGPIGGVQDALLGITSREGKKTTAEDLQNLASSLAGQVVIKPRMQSAAHLVVDEGSGPENVLFETKVAASDGKSLYLTGCLNGSTINGHAILSTGSDKKTVFRVPWSFDGVPVDTDTVRISAVRAFSDQWCAWLVSAGNRTRIYLILPGKNATVFAPSSLEVANAAFEKRSVFIGQESEDSISRIGRDKSGESLVIEAAGARHLLPLGSRIVPMLQESINAEGMGVVMLYGSDLADCSRVGLKVPTAKYHGAVTWSEIQEVRMPKSVADSEQVAGILWPEPGAIAVKRDGAWDLWRLHKGLLERASPSEAASLDRQIEENRNLAARLLQRINQPRQPDNDPRFSHLADLRVKNAFVLETDSALLLVGREGTLDGEQPGVVVRSGLAFEFYNKNNIERWPQKAFVLNAFGVRKQFAGVTEFYEEIALSPDGKRAVATTKSGNSLYIVDASAPPARLGAASTHTILGNAVCAVRSPLSPQKFSIVLGDGDYLSGDGTAAGLVLSDGHNALNLSQLEAKYNRPDVVLERLGADESLIKEARRLRERLVRRSDFKSFDGAALIDIPLVSVKTEVPEKTDNKSLTLDFEASNSTGPLKELRVFNNGALVQTISLSGKDGQPSRESVGEAKVDLASGENRLQLMAVSEEGFTSAFAEKRVNCTAEPDSRRCFIAAVGVSEYNDPRFNLKFAAKDAEDMSKALAEKAQHRGYQPEVMVVSNAEVDGTLVEKLREFLAQAGADDEVVLFFAGHGLLDKDLEYHFARHDTDFDASENMGITFQELESLVDGIKPLKRTVLFDTCHSGEVEEEDKPQLLAMVGGAAAPAAGAGVQVRGVATRGMKVKELEPKLRHTDFVELESLFPDSRRAKGANILTSSSGSEFSMESDAWKNGLFTYAFLNALKDEKTDADGDKAVSFSEVAAAVQDKVKTLSGGQQRPITRGVNREAEVALASFGPPVAPIPAKEKKSGLWPF